MVPILIIAFSATFKDTLGTAVSCIVSNSSTLISIFSGSLPGMIFLMILHKVPKNGNRIKVVVTLKIIWATAICIINGIFNVLDK